MSDDVNQPSHYIIETPKGKIECIYIIHALKLGYNLGNVFKYVWRCGRKTQDRLKDLRKAATYLQFEIEQEENRVRNS